MGKFFSLLISISIILLGCKEKDQSKRIHAGEFDMEGLFIDGIVPDGPIKYYLPNSSEVVAIKEFSKGVLHGKSFNFHGSNLIQDVNYEHGVEVGFGRIYDSSTSALKQTVYYHYGRRMGPISSFDRFGKLLHYEFCNFEGDVVFSTELDSSGENYFSDDIDKLDVLSVSEILVNNKKKIQLFFYLIYPPFSNVNYSVCYLDEDDKVIRSIEASEKNEEIFWNGNLELPSKGQKLALVINKYDSLDQKTQTLITYLETKE